MFEMLPESSDEVFGMKVSGKLTDEDYKEFLPKLEQAIAKSGALSILWLMEDFHGWELKAMWDDASWGMKHQKDIDRVAMVGDKKWERWMTKLAGACTRGEVKYFDHSELESAWNWIRG